MATNTVARCHGDPARCSQYPSEKNHDPAVLSRQNLRRVRRRERAPARGACARRAHERIQLHNVRIELNHEQVVPGVEVGALEPCQRPR